MTQMLQSKEFYELMSQFEKDLAPRNFQREDKHLWLKGVYYCNGETNNFFKAYQLGYENAKCLARLGEFN